MADYREVRHERLYVKEPNTERMRKSSAGRLRYLLSTGWRETERWHAEDHMTVRLERTGVAPKMTRLPKIAPAPPRPPRRGGPGMGGPGGRFGQGGGGPGGRGAPGQGGPGGRGAPGQGGAPPGGRR